MRYYYAKPCPFCGCSSVTVKDISGYFRVKCDGCEARSGYEASKASALIRWNRRTTDTPSKN
ncbi:Lar family restriction alleviation protein [Enterobacter ludwigii]|uniref:Lar family restriction alleviation protein n=1 Tax=Enterobacter ludwigii TaxID=299767 RepID=UPI002A80693C|nr:Lar family restriction alleviation protein [Enterobacter ludwigii]